MTRLPVEIRQALDAAKIAETRSILWISVGEQRLRLYHHGVPVAEYAVSTSAKGTGCRQNSFQTPTGLHRVAKKIGEGQPVGMVFKERKPTTLNAQRSTLNEDRILTRILWLEGLEPGVNQGGEVDTFERYIYIHGTNHEDKIGQPASLGCVRMRNDDVVKLFDAVEEGTLVWIG